MYPIRMNHSRGVILLSWIAFDSTYRPPDLVDRAGATHQHTTNLITDHTKYRVELIIIFSPFFRNHLVNLGGK